MPIWVPSSSATPKRSKPSLLLALLLLASARRDKAEGAFETARTLRGNGLIALVLGALLVAVDTALWVLEGAVHPVPANRLR